MKVVILAGGYGTRISEESHLKPKPMIEIGDQPILWHIMKSYSYYGYNEFIICAGYKQHVIKEVRQYSPSFTVWRQGIIDSLRQETRTAAEADICQLAFFKLSFVFVSKDAFFLS